MTIDHRPSMSVQAAMNKAHWLRTRKHVDLDVVETVDALVDALMRLDAAMRSIQGAQARQIGRVESKLGQFESRLRVAGILPTKVAK